MELKTSELMHYGVLGMKWGVRRYQNRDGSYTAAGKKRRQSGRASERNQNEERSIKVKKAIIIGAVVAGTALAAYGGTKLIKNVKVDKQIKKTVEDQVKKYASQKADFYFNRHKELHGHYPDPHVRNTLYESFYPSQERIAQERDKLKQAYRQSQRDFKTAKRSYRRGKSRWIPDFDLDYNPLLRYEFKG